MRNLPVWTLVYRGRIPIRLEFRDLSVIICTDDDRRVEMVWVQDTQFDPLSCWVLRDGERALGFESSLSEERTGGVAEFTNLREVSSLSRPRTNWMLANMQRAIRGRNRKLPDWAKRLWDEALELVRSVVHPIALANLTVDAGRQLALTLNTDRSGVLAAHSLLGMNNFPAMRLRILSPADKETLEQLVAYGEWPPEFPDVTVIVRVTEEFDEGTALNFMEAIYPGLSSMVLVAKN